MSQAVASTRDRRAIAKAGRLLAAGILVVNNWVLLGVVTSSKSDAEILGHAKGLSLWRQGQVPHALVSDVMVRVRYSRVCH